MCVRAQRTAVRDGLTRVEVGFDLDATAESFATEAPATLPGGLECCRDFNLR